MTTLVREDDAAVLATVVRSLAGDVHRQVGSDARRPRELNALVGRIHYLANELRQHQPESPLLRWLSNLEREVEMALRRQDPRAGQAACA